MTKQSWWWVLGFLAIVGLISFFVGIKSESPQTENKEVSDEATSQTNNPKFEWEFSPAGGDPVTGAFKTSVVLLVEGEQHELGMYSGSCSVLGGDFSWERAPGEVTGVICYFAGAGDELGVFYENGDYVVKKGVIEEGSEETPSFRGNYETLFAL